MTDTSWQEQLYLTLRRQGVSQIVYVPDGGHKHLIRRALEDPEVHAFPLTTEEEGVAIAAGADLGGARAVLLMQSSGVGNCINLLSLIKIARFPFLTLVTMRGEYGEGNPWQYPMGQGTPAVLEAMGVTVLRVDQPQDVVPTTQAACVMSYQTGHAVAVLLSQRLLGAKAYDPSRYSYGAL